MKTIEEIRAALTHIHHYAMEQTGQPYMSIPADPKRDADLIISAAISELEQLRVAQSSFIATMQRMQSSFRKTPSESSEAIVSVLSDLIRLAAEQRAGDGKRETAG